MLIAILESTMQHIKNRVIFPQTLNNVDFGMGFTLDCPEPKMIHWLLQTHLCEILYHDTLH